MMTYGSGDNYRGISLSSALAKIHDMDLYMVRGFGLYQILCRIKYEHSVPCLNATLETFSERFHHASKEKR